MRTEGRFITYDDDHREKCSPVVTGSKYVISDLRMLGVHEEGSA
jgi:hypothetical protein